MTYTDVKMILHRYELYRGDIYQEIGFMTGLSRLDLLVEDEEALMTPFNENLAVPPMVRHNTASFFTETGNKRFQEEIEALISAYANSLYTVMERIFELPRSNFADILYQDENQVCIPCSLYAKLTENVQEE